MYNYSGYTELPSNMSEWQANTHYKVTGTTEVSYSLIRFPQSIDAGINPGINPGIGITNLLTSKSGVCIHVIEGGTLVFPSKQALSIGSESAIHVHNGKLEINGAFAMKDGCAIKTDSDGVVVVKSGTQIFGKNCDLDFRAGKLSFESGTFNLGEGSVLSLDNQPVEGTGTISGNGAVLNAPIRRVFSDGIVVTGDWKIDRSYPQWFADSTTGDWSAAINAAIKMKQCGEVFLPAGEYRVKNSIFVPYGITLAGEKAAGGEKEQEDSDGPIDIKNTILMPVVGGSFTNNYVILVNADKKEGDKPSWKKDYPTHYTAVKDLSMRGNAVVVRGIYVAGGARIEGVRWKYLSQGVAFDPDCYSDQKQVVNCRFDYPEYGNGEIPAAYDLSGLGNALVFTGNGGCSKEVVLKLSYCNGGIVDSNVLNGTVVIRKCKGLRFSSNHIETDWLCSVATNRAPGLEIEESTVTVVDNFIEKGTKPGICIKGNSSNGSNSVVTLQNNSFLFYDTIRYSTKEGDIYVPESLSEMRERIYNTSEADVSVDKQSIVYMQNNYKHWVGNYGIGSGSIYGLCLSLQSPDGSMKSFTEFNNYSHVYSVECSISGGSVVSPLKPTASFGGSVGYLQSNPNLEWLSVFLEEPVEERVRNKVVEACKNYYYYVVLDGDKEKSAPVAFFENNVCDLKKFDKDPGEEELVHYKDHMEGAIMVVTGISETGNRTRIRLYRRSFETIRYDSNSSEEDVHCMYVDIPVVGTNVLYDNGISIAGGYKWKNVEDEA